jgi:type II secretory ATPase GspE/PulE/Tfp pilus assembly ATPase PilB-like protein
VLAQRLVRKLCSGCKTEHVVAEDEVRAVPSLVSALVGRPAWAPAGCPECLEGYTGRTGLFELMVPNRRMADRIRARDVAAEDMRALAEEGGMTGLAADGIDKIRRGITSVPEVLAVAAS